MPSDDLERLSHWVVEIWEPPGRRLNIEDKKLTAVDKKNVQCNEKAYKKLRHLKQKEGSAATLEVLCDALCHEFLNRKDLAEKIFQWNAWNY